MVKIWELCVGNRLKEKNEIERQLNLRLNFAEYFRLRTMILRIHRLYGEINSIGVNVQNVMTNKKIKVGHLRQLLCKKGTPHYDNNDPRTIPSAVTLWGDEIRNVDR